jgi:transitional endoplasmic reticulum ATPase
MNLEALKLALAASPDNVPLLLMVAKLHEDQFELLEARNCLDRVVQLQADHPEALLGLARLIDMAGETSEAVVRLDALCAMKPDFAAAWLLRARIALDEKEAQAARAYYDKAVALDRSVADDELLASILKAGGGKRSAMTANGPDRNR